MLKNFVNPLFRAGLFLEEHMKKLFIALTLVFMSLATHALEFRRSGDTLFVSGPVQPGDYSKFKTFFEAQPANSIRQARLNSPGGSIREAGDIAYIFRKNNITTIVDAGSNNCSSACTVLFAGGVERVYLNAGGIKEGVGPLAGRGLGFHEGNEKLSRQPGGYSGVATGQMIGYYSQYGMSGAREFITQAGPRQMYRINSQTALTKGIATRIR
jgi:hypothetical protein